MSALDAVKMDCYSFTMDVTGIDLDNSAYEDRLYEAGCGDALIVVSDGRLSLDFDRMALSYGLAVESAIKDISNAGGMVTDIKRIEH
jgi:hypothetical protein